MSSIGGAGRAAGTAAWGNSGAPERAADRLEPTWETIEHRYLEPAYGWVARVVDFSYWVLERIRIIYPVQWYRWLTAGDERTCPECGPYHGETWPEDSPLAIAPPLHYNCRCLVAWSHTEYRVRYVQEWRLRWGQRTVYDWRQVDTVERVVTERRRIR